MPTLDGAGYPTIQRLDSLGAGLIALPQPDTSAQLVQTLGLSRRCETRVFVLPIMEPTDSFFAVYEEAFSYVYYNRIHLFPNPLDFGAILTPVVRTVEVWNAYLELPQTLTGVVPASLQGVTLTTGILPRVFAPLQSVLFNIAASLDGPPAINGTETFSFTGLVDSILTVVGTRSFIWSLRHNWSELPQETWAFRTNRHQGLSGKEQRIGTRVNPRRTIRLSYLANGNFARAAAERKIWIGSTYQFAVPMWQDANTLTANVAVGANSIPVNTVGRDFDVGGTLLLWRQVDDQTARFEAPTISAVSDTSITLAGLTTLDWRVGDYAVPVRRAFLPDSFTWEDITDQLATFTINWELVPSEVSVKRYATTLGFPTYRTLNVLTRASSYNDNLGQSQSRRIINIDSDIGGRRLYPIHNAPQPSFLYQRMTRDRDEFKAFLGFLYYLKGARKTVWIPTYKTDFVLKANVLSADVSIKVDDWQYLEHFAIADSRRDIAILLKNGTAIYRRINTVVKSAGSTETLTLDSAVGVAFAPSDVLMISLMRRCRLAEDEFSATFETDRVARFDIRFTELTTTP